MTDTTCEDIFVSTDLDIFPEELVVTESIHNRITYHTFQENNMIMFNSCIDLRCHLNKYDIEHYMSCIGSIDKSLYFALYFDGLKYKNMAIIPKLSRKQKRYNEYLKIIRLYFDKMKLSITDKKSKYIAPYKIYSDINTTIASLHTGIFYKYIIIDIIQIKLAIIQGYVVITGLKIANKLDVINIIGFDNSNFIIRKHNNMSLYSDEFLPYDYILDNCFDTCILYSHSGCKHEINLGFIR